MNSFAKYLANWIPGAVIDSTQVVGEFTNIYTALQG